MITEHTIRFLLKILKHTQTYEKTKTSIDIDPAIMLHRNRYQYVLMMERQLVQTIWKKISLKKVKGCMTLTAAV